MEEIVLAESACVSQNTKACSSSLRPGKNERICICVPSHRY